METRRNRSLTDREREVLFLISEGETNAAIAERLWLSVRTVNHHVENALEKLGARNRAEAVGRGLREGWLNDV